MSSISPKQPTSNPTLIVVVLGAIALCGVFFAWLVMSKAQNAADAAGAVAATPAPVTSPDTPHLLPKGQKMVSCAAKEVDWGYLCTLRPWRAGDVAESYTIVNQFPHSTSVYYIREVAP